MWNKDRLPRAISLQVRAAGSVKNLLGASSNFLGIGKWGEVIENKFSNNCGGAPELVNKENRASIDSFAEEE